MVVPKSFEKNQLLNGRYWPDEENSREEIARTTALLDALIRVSMHGKLPVYRYILLNTS
jgi:hypothetical protein